MRVIYCVIMITFFISCKKEDKSKGSEIIVQETKDEVIKEVVKDKFIFEAEVVTDNGGLFYANFKFDNGTKPINIYKKIIPSKEAQIFKAEIDLKKLDFPSAMVFYLGKEEAKNVEIRNIHFSSYGNEISFKGNELSNYFVPNSYIKIDSELGLVKTIKINNSHLPTLTLKHKVLDSLLN